MPADKTSSHGSKNLIIIVFLIIAAAAGYGYFTQSEELRDTNEATAATNTPTPAANDMAATAIPPEPGKVTLPPANHPVFTARDGEILVGKPDAPHTIVEYASLSCPHCAHFEETVLPDVTKEYIKPGKAKLVFRHFPLNEPAMRAAQVVECIGGDTRKPLISTFFAEQKDWAFREDFMDPLKKLAAKNGMDSARFSSCMNDKAIENRILGVRTEAAQVLGVEHTPALFIDGKPYEGEVNIEGLRKALGQ